MIDLPTKGWLKRQSVWRHNGYMGTARLIESQCRAMIRSDTTTPATKEIAARILEDALLLARSLKQRVDNET